MLNKTSNTQKALTQAWLTKVRRFISRNPQGVFFVILRKRL